MAHAAEYDSHGHKDHGHVIVSVATLRVVLGALLFFTLLTSGAAEAEKWIAHAFNVEIPLWLNAFIALGIAAIKTTLVVLFFMQLKYDNPLNTMVFIFTLMTVMFFLGLTTMDLVNRGTLDPMKARYEVEGGTGALKGSVSEGQSNTAITKAARDAAIAAGKFDPHKAAHAALPPPGLSMTEAGYLAPKPARGSSSNVSRPVRGVTIPGLPGYKAPEAHAVPGDHAPVPHATPAAPPDPQAPPQKSPDGH